MAPLRNLKTWVFLFSVLLLIHHKSFAQEASVSNVIVTNTRDDLLVYMKVEGAFKEKMKQAILSGVPTTFSYLIRLNRVRNMWGDKNIVDLQLFKHGSLSL